MVIYLSISDREEDKEAIYQRFHRVRWEGVVDLCDMVMTIMNFHFGKSEENEIGVDQYENKCGIDFRNY